jgi:hypothetical protein
MPCSLGHVEGLCRGPLFGVADTLHIVTSGRTYLRCRTFRVAVFLFSSHSASTHSFSSTLSNNSPAPRWPPRLSLTLQYRARNKIFLIAIPFFAVALLVPFFPSSHTIVILCLSIPPPSCSSSKPFSSGVLRPIGPRGLDREPE